MVGSAHNRQVYYRPVGNRRHDEVSNRSVVDLVEGRVGLQPTSLLLAGWKPAPRWPVGNWPHDATLIRKLRTFFTQSTQFVFTITLTVAKEFL